MPPGSPPWKAGPLLPMTTANGRARSWCRSKVRHFRAWKADGGADRERRSTIDKLSLIGQIGNNAGVFRTLTAQSVKEVRPGVYVYNMGQNLVGVPRISIANGRAGGRITLRFSEMLYPDLKESGKNVGMLMTENYRAALSQDVYTMKAGSQVFQPRFTSHGYQYVEITGIDKPLPLAAVQGVAISSVRELTADYKTSNAEGQPAVVESCVVQRRQLPHDTDRLPATQRAHGLVR